MQVLVVCLVLFGTCHGLAEKKVTLPQGTQVTNLVVTSDGNAFISTKDDTQAYLYTYNKKTDTLNPPLTFTSISNLAVGKDNNGYMVASSVGDLYTHYIVTMDNGTQTHTMSRRTTTICSGGVSTITDLDDAAILGYKDKVTMYRRSGRRTSTEPIDIRDLSSQIDHYGVDTKHNVYFASETGQMSLLKKKERTQTKFRPSVRNIHVRTPYKVNALVLDSKDQVHIATVKGSRLIVGYENVYYYNRNKNVRFLTVNKQGHVYNTIGEKAYKHTVSGIMGEEEETPIEVTGFEGQDGNDYFIGLVTDKDDYSYFATKEYAVYRTKSTDDTEVIKLEYTPTQVIQTFKYDPDHGVIAVGDNIYSYPSSNVSVETTLGAGDKLVAPGKDASYVTVGMDLYGIDFTQ